MKKVAVFIYILLTSVRLEAQINITALEAKDHLNEIVSICDRITDARFLDSSASKSTLLNVGGAYPDHLFSIAIKNESRVNFPFKPEEYYLNKKVCVVGRLVDFSGKPQIVVLSPAEIIIDRNDTGLPAAPTPIIQPDTTNTANTTKTPNVSLNKNTRADSTIKRTDTIVQSSNGSKVSNRISNSNTTGLPPKVKVEVPESKSSDAYPIKISSDLKLRANPKEDADVLEVLKAGSTVFVIRSANGWSYISFQPKSPGQVLKGYIQNRVLK